MKEESTMDAIENRSEADVQKEDTCEHKKPQLVPNEVNSAILKDEEPSPPRQTVAAVDMTGLIKSPRTSLFSKLKKNSLGNRKPKVDESLSKQRFRYLDSDDEGAIIFDGPSEMDFSRQSEQSETVSRELTVQQIHDQRAKLSAASLIPQSNADPEAPPAKSSTQQRPMSSKRLREPGAYSVERSGIDISVRTKNKDDDDNDSILDKEYGSSMMQLEAVPVDETLEQAKMKEMEEQMNLEISRRLSLERRMTDRETGHNRSFSKAKERMPIIMALLILISGIAVGVYFLVAPASADDTSAYFIYLPPTEQECSAVMNGGAVQDQDKYSTLMVDLTLEVSVGTALADSVDAVLLEVEKKFQSVVVPMVVGCSRIGQSQEYFGTTFTEDRYILANVDIVNVTRSPEDCKAGEPRPCVRAVVRYVAWLKGGAGVFQLMSFVQKNFGPMLLQDMSDGETILKTDLVSISSSEYDINTPIDTPSVDLEFPPPTDEECEAVLNGHPVPDQDKYHTLMIDTIVDVSTYKVYTNDTVLQEVQEKIMFNAIPTMVGCTTVSQNIKNSTGRYILANANITKVTRSPSDCDLAHIQPCERIVVRFSLWLKDAAALFDLVAILHTDFQPILHESITASDVIQDFVLVSIGPPLGDSTPQVDNAPTVDLLFPPPTKEQCEQSLLSGTAIEDRDQYFTMLADGIIDVSTYNPWRDNLDAVLLELRNQFQSIVLPILAGCIEIAEDQLEGKTLTPDRYIMADGAVLDVTTSPLDCNANEPQPCVRAVVRIQIWLKREVTIFEVIAGIDQNFGPALIAQIGSDDSADIIKQAEMVNLAPAF